LFIGDFSDLNMNYWTENNYGLCDYENDNYMTSCHRFNCDCNEPYTSNTSSSFISGFIGLGWQNSSGKSTN